MEGVRRQGRARIKGQSLWVYRSLVSVKPIFLGRVPIRVEGQTGMSAAHKQIVGKKQTKL